MKFSVLCLFITVFTLAGVETKATSHTTDLEILDEDVTTKKTLGIVVQVSEKFYNNHLGSRLSLKTKVFQNDFLISELISSALISALQPTIDAILIGKVYTSENKLLIASKKLDYILIVSDGFLCLDYHCQIVHKGHGVFFNFGHETSLSSALQYRFINVRTKKSVHFRNVIALSDISPIRIVKNTEDDIKKFRDPLRCLIEKSALVALDKLRNILQINNFSFKEKYRDFGNNVEYSVYRGGGVVYKNTSIYYSDKCLEIFPLKDEVDELRRVAKEKKLAHELESR